MRLVTCVEVRGHLSAPTALSQGKSPVIHCQEKSVYPPNRLKAEAKRNI